MTVYSGEEYLIEDQDCRGTRALSQAFEHLKVKPVTRPSVRYINHDYHYERTQITEC